MKWLKDNLIQVLMILGSFIFSYASLSGKTEANASAILTIQEDRKAAKIRNDERLDNINNKLDSLKTSVDTLLERTKRL